MLCWKQEARGWIQEPTRSNLWHGWRHSGIRQSGLGASVNRPGSPRIEGWGEAVEIDGRTRLVGVIGWPVEHSLSPRMHNSAFGALGLNYAYVPLPVVPDRVVDAIQGLAALSFVGANVTVPYKSAVLPHLSELSPVARAIGAVNTLIVKPDGTLLGDNTDAYGFMTDLAEAGWPGGSPSGCRALVIGAGGAARAVTYGLLEGGAEVAVANRSFDRTLNLCKSLGRALAAADVPAATRLSAHRYPEDLEILAPGADLIINATKLGLNPNYDPLPWDPNVPFHPRQLVYDLVPLATPAGETPFLALAASRGARVRGGLGMLVHQGARAFEMWTGVKAPVEVMKEALRQGQGK
jgi:shikimate dehydrogenase